MSTNSIWVSISCAEPAISRILSSRGSGTATRPTLGSIVQKDIGRLRRGGLGQRIEKRRFADVRQADDAAAEAHGFSVIRHWIDSGSMFAAQC